MFVAVRPVVEALTILASVEKRVVTVPTVVEAVLSTVCPDTVRAVVEAFWRLVLPVAVKRVVVVVAKVEVPVVKNGPDTLRAVEEADASVV